MNDSPLLPLTKVCSRVTRSAQDPTHTLTRSCYIPGLIVAIWPLRAKFCSDKPSKDEWSRPEWWDLNGGDKPVLRFFHLHGKKKKKKSKKREESQGLDLKRPNAAPWFMEIYAPPPTHPHPFWNTFSWNWKDFRGLKHQRRWSFPRLSLNELFSFY